MNETLLQSLAQDLRKTPPPSPHEKLGSYVIAARTLVKCRAFHLGWNGEYNYFPCGLSAFLWEFTGLDPNAFKEFVATGASDAEAANWFRQYSKVQDPLAIVRWNNSLRDKRISELPDSYQEFYEEYIPTFCPQPHKVRFFFDVYDAEEHRL